MTSPTPGRVSRLTAKPDALPRDGVVICVDVGTKRSGVAATDPEQRVATPRDPIQHTSDAALVRATIALAHEMHAVGVVVGLPLSPNGQENKATTRIRTLARTLADGGFDVCLVDERFTTVAAERAMRDGGLTARQQRDRLDSPAAALILATWVERRRGL